MKKSRRSVENIEIVHSRSDEASAAKHNSEKQEISENIYRIEGTVTQERTEKMVQLIKTKRSTLYNKIKPHHKKEKAGKSAGSSHGVSGSDAKDEFKNNCSNVYVRCTVNFETERDFKRHVKLCQKSKDETTVCASCCKTFSNALLLGQHLNEGCPNKTNYDASACSKMEEDVGQEGTPLEVKSEPVSLQSSVQDGNEIPDVRIIKFLLNGHHIFQSYLAVKGISYNKKIPKNLPLKLECMPKWMPKPKKFYYYIINL